MPNTSSGRVYSERLVPSASFYIVVLLLVPGITILMVPFNINLGVVYGLIAYILVVALFLVTSRTLSVDGSVLRAGRASIPVDQIGEVIPLEGNDFRLAIGRRLDARAHLVISGWIRKGLRVEILDPSDPAPYWILSTRRPHVLKRAIEDAQRRGNAS